MENNQKIEDKEKVQRVKKKAKYTLLTFVLLICILQLTFSNIQNINKNIKFSSKIKSLEQKRDEELAKNQRLKSDLENFNSEEILESIARNNLKMAGKDEILIIINKEEEPIEEETKEKGLFKKKKKNKKDKK